MTKNFKIIGLALVAMMSIALVGCGNKAEEEGNGAVTGGKAVSPDTAGRLQTADDSMGGGGAGTNDSVGAATPPPSDN